jgi:hypothetical protein
MTIIPCSHDNNYCQRQLNAIQKLYHEQIEKDTKTDALDNVLIVTDSIKCTHIQDRALSYIAITYQSMEEGCQKPIEWVKKSLIPKQEISFFPKLLD